jgi:two-component SAPR family response regulator
MSNRILLADDSLTIQKVVELTFSESGWELMTVGSGDKAIEAYASFRPDVVLADVVMPGLSGYEVCERIKQSEGGALVPVVLSPEPSSPSIGPAPNAWAVIPSSRNRSTRTLSRTWWPSWRAGRGRRARKPRRPRRP